VHYFLPQLRIINDELHTIQARIEAAVDGYVPSANTFRDRKPLLQRPVLFQNGVEFTQDEAELEECREEASSDPFGGWSASCFSLRSARGSLTTSRV
jgi:hypothetical protein